MGGGLKYVGSGSVRTRWLTFSLAGVAGLALLAASGCGEQAAAITVGDSYVSQSDFMHEVGKYADMEAEAEQQGGAVASEDGSYSQEFVGRVASERVIHMLSVQLFEGQGLELTEGDELEMCTAAMQQQTGADPTQAGTDPCGSFLDAQGLGDAPDWYRDQIVEEQAMNYLLQQEVDPQELQTASQDLLDNTEITINSKYGTWDDDLFQEFLATPQGEQPVYPVVPPEGPFVQGDGDDAAPDAPEAPGEPDTGTPPADVSLDDLDPDLVALLEEYGMDPTTLTPQDLAGMASQIEMMGMDPSDLTPEELAELESQLQRPPGGAQPGGGGQPGGAAPGAGTAEPGGAPTP